jgi:hypothetical protein
MRNSTTATIIMSTPGIINGKLINPAMARLGVPTNTVPITARTVNPRPSRSRTTPATIFKKRFMVAKASTGYRGVNSQRFRNSGGARPTKPLSIKNRMVEGLVIGANCSDMVTEITGARNDAGRYC